MKRYLIPAERTRTEILVVNSRFIATVTPVFSVEEARAFIQEIKNEFNDATHNVPAFLVGYGTSVIAHCSDDGEPSGTAGRPALAVLQGSGLGDVAVVVTRYFGGTKLGTGGLVRAYTEAVKSVLEVLPYAEKVPTHKVLLVVPYPIFEQTRLLVEKYNGKILDEDFAADVTMTVQFQVEQLPEFNADISELTRGQIEALILETNPETIMPFRNISSMGK
ncbi:MAG: YigZ family protein [Chloroflexi bacterium HGW-Chloroflexi-10]|nr:MAG: YigZ family protein [Chloroflexi bacterium HGW-Chloroflexi-10]